MSEYLWAKIEIGGTISRAVLTNLVDKFGVVPPVSEGAGTTASGAAPYLVCEDDEAPSGMFEGLESYLVKQAIPFNRASDSRYEHTAELRYFRPAVDGGSGSESQPEVDRILLCDHENRPMVASADVDKALAETKTREELVACLIVMCGMDIPALPPVSLIESAE